MLYRIYSTGPGSDRHLTRRRSDAALLAAENLAYELISGQGGLDTDWGHAAMQKVRGLDPRKGGTVSIQAYTLFLTCDTWGARS
jgi:hypothetical protein